MKKYLKLLPLLVLTLLITACEKRLRPVLQKYTGIEICVADVLWS